MRKQHSRGKAYEFDLMFYERLDNLEKLCLQYMLPMYEATSNHEP
jgi:hypothetical protein